MIEILEEVAREAAGTDLAERAELQVAQLLAEDRRFGLLARELLQKVADHAKQPARRVAALVWMAGLDDRDALPERARARRCELLAIDPIEQEARALARSLFEAGDLDPVRLACKRRQCPCIEPVLAALGDDLREADDDANGAEVVELLLARAPHAKALPEAMCHLIQIRERGGVTARLLREARALRTGPTSEWALANPGRTVAACDAPTAPPPVPEIIAKDSRFGRCFTPATAKGRAELEIDTRGPRPIVRATARTTTPPAVTECLAAAFRRHRWSGTGEILVVPVKLSPW